MKIRKFPVFPATIDRGENEIAVSLTQVTNINTKLSLMYTSHTLQLNSNSMRSGIEREFKPVLGNIVFSLKLKHEDKIS